MTTLILSNRISLPLTASVESAKWDGDRPSVEGYEIAILDLFFGPPSGGYIGYTELTELGTINASFYELGDEVAKSLQGGGTVVALLGPLAVNKRNLNHTYASELVQSRREYSYQGKYQNEYETSYDWLDQGFLEETCIDKMFVKQSQGINVITTIEEMRDYTSIYADKYWVSISGISFKSETENIGTIRQRVAQSERWQLGLGAPYPVASYPAIVLAKGKHTKLPVAAAIKYLNWDGILILVPPPDSKKLEGAESTNKCCYLLESLAKRIREQLFEAEEIEHEEWVLEHRAPKAKELVSQIKSLKDKTETLIDELNNYDKMLPLLDGTDTPLVDSVEFLFDNSGEGITVERTEKGNSIDLYINDDKGRRLVVEVTGINGTLRKKDPHWADFLGYMPEHNERNENGRVERIVLIVNTERKTKLGDRNPANDITDPVQKTALDNHICVIRSCDLYKLWLRTLEGIKIKEIFQMLFDCDGIFKFA